MPTPNARSPFVRRFIRRSAPFAACLLLLGASGATMGCQSAQSAVDAVDTASRLFGDWDLSSLAGVDLAGALGGGAKAPGLSFGSDGKVSGFAGVNRIASSVDLDALSRGQFKLAPTAATKMAGPPAAMDLENAFLSALSRADSFDVKGDTLTLSQGASRLMEFARRK